MRRRYACFALALVLASVAARELPAAQTQIWTADASDLSNGTVESVAITQRGGMFLAPRMARLGTAEPPGAAFGWSVVGDARGSVFAGTGSSGSVLRWAPGGDSSVFFASPEPMVTALLLLSGGDLLAATAPGGKIYRIEPSGQSQLWCDSGERYVWALAGAADGTIYAATGDRGTLLRIDRHGQAEPVFKSGEAHLTALLVLEDGTLVAGSAGSGLIFRILPNGKATVWYDGDLPEVVDLAAAPDGLIYAGFLGAPDSDPRPPAVRIQLPQGGARSSTDAMGGMDDRSAPTLEGVIEGLPSSPEGRGARRARGRVLRVSPSGGARELWRSSSESVLALAIDGAGRPIFGTGEPARLYRLGDDDEVQRLAVLPEGQVTSLSAVADGMLLLTSNPAAAYRIERSSADSGSFVSEAIDAGGPAHWGPVVWSASDGTDSPVLVVQVRTGNSSQPDDSWCAWTQARTASDPGPRVADGRFLQWRARFTGATREGFRAERFALSYTPYNRPPLVESFRVDARKSSFADKIPFAFSVSDPDGDALVSEIQYRAIGTREWLTALRSDARDDAAEEGSDATDPDGKETWEIGAMSEGRYEVRVLASDAAANRQGEGFKETSPRTLLVTIDRTPPAVRVERTADGIVEVEGEDSLSALGCLEVTEAGRAVHTIAAIDGVCDGRRERFVVRPEDAAPAENPAFRLGDAAGNSTAVDIPGR